MEPQYLTQEKFEALQHELKDLRENKIIELAKRIDEARQNGDLSENAEYHQAREDLAWAQSRIKEIEAILEDAEIITKNAPGGAIDLGSVITVEANDKKRTLTIVGAQEADPSNGKISNESPLGSNFIGKKEGDTITVNVPAGTLSYTILKVE